MDAEQLKTLQGHTVDGPLLIKPKVFGDERGWFFESWNQKKFNSALGKSLILTVAAHEQRIYWLFDLYVSLMCIKQPWFTKQSVTNSDIVQAVKCYNVCLPEYLANTCEWM